MTDALKALRQVMFGYGDRMVVRDDDASRILTEAVAAERARIQEAMMAAVPFASSVLSDNGIEGFGFEVKRWIRDMDIIAMIREACAPLQEEDRDGPR